MFVLYMATAVLSPDLSADCAGQITVPVQSTGSIPESVLGLDMRSVVSRDPLAGKDHTCIYSSILNSMQRARPDIRTITVSRDIRPYSGRCPYPSSIGAMSLFFNVDILSLLRMKANDYVYSVCT